jgi:hypothetical protein
MNREQIERSLHQPGPLEQGYRPAALSARLADARQRSGWRGTLLAVGQLGMVAAAVVAGTAIAVLLTRTPTPGANGVGAGAPTPTEAASLAPSTIDACRAEDFAWSTDPWGGAAGSRGTTVLPRGVTSLRACQIQGRAALVLSDASGHTLLAAQSAVSAISVHGGTLLEIDISWSNWCGADPATPLSLSLTLPGDNHPVPLVASAGGILVPPCLGQGQPSVLNATDFQLSSRAAPEG